MFNLSKYLDQQEVKTFKFTLAISLTLIVVIFWDILGMKIEVDSFYILQKSFFIFGPLLVFFIPRLSDQAKHIIIACLYYLYSYINSVYVDKSYFTAFIQFYFGSVFIFRYKTIGFAFTHIVGIVLYAMVLLDLESKLPKEEFVSLVQLMNGALFPIYFITILIYFNIRKKETEDAVKSEFFKQVGQNVGFILHEIKQPLQKLQFNHNDRTILEVNELLETANILWPSGENKKAVLTRVDVKEIIDSILKEFESYLKYINIKISLFHDELSVKSNRAILRIVLKNIIKNALEEMAGKDGENYLKIKLHSDNSLLFKNNIDEKVNVTQVFDAGYSTKSHIANKGLGLYICKNLSEKIGIKLSAFSTDSEFQVKLKL